MKKKLLMILIAIALLAQTIYLPSFANSLEQQQRALRGIWVASVLNLDYPSSATTSIYQLKSEAIEILDRAVDTGLNAVFLQVRPTGDAFYRSTIFPWSQYLTGSQGIAPPDGFDPLSFWVTEAHARGLELHAWINPYRITKRKNSDPIQTVDMLSLNNPARLHPDWVVSYGKGDLYYNPGVPQVQDLVVDGVVEIIQNYPIDGIHFDDYFYPGRDFNDSATYATYSNGLSLDDWRRQNVNQMVAKVYQAIKTTDPNVVFGISPFGIWANQSSKQNGSATRGNESFSSHYADSLAWIKAGTVDYIMPQLYWHIGFDIADYQVLLNWWSNAVKGSEVKLYVGHAAYRTGNKDKKSPWYGNDEIIKQLAINQRNPQVAGSVFFRDGTLKSRPSLQNTIKAYYQKIDAGDIYTTLSVNTPANNITTSLANHYVTGVANPFFPLYVNGEEVTARSPQGYFGVYLPLVNGRNTFTFTQEGQKDVLVINRGWASGGGSQPKAVAAAIDKASTYPQHSDLYRVGEKYSLSCRAPIGATVTATFGGKSFSLKPSSTANVGTAVILTTYSTKVVAPELPAGKKKVNLGSPIYKMSFRGKSEVVHAPAQIDIISDDAPMYGEIIGENIDTYFKKNPRKGSDYLLAKGMVEAVTGVQGNYVRLATDRWVKRDNIRLFYDLEKTYNSVSQATYYTGERFDYIDVAMSKPVATSVQMKDGIVAVDFSETSSLPDVKNLNSTLVSSVKQDTYKGRSTYYIRFKDTRDLNGYFVEKTDGGVRIYLKKPVVISNPERPLEGISILIDPGHGGDDAGAIGLLDRDRSEQSINLSASLKLERHLKNLGATVHLTRSDDSSVSLYDRLRMSLALKPDLFVSIHANSIGPDVNINYVRGFSVHYKREIAKAVSRAISNQVISNLDRMNRGLSVNNFYVVRGTWTPSILLEMGFVPNPYEFEWLTNDLHQEMLTKHIAQGIVDYFRR